MSSLTPAAWGLGLSLVLSPIANVQAAELQILAGGAMTGPLRELGAQFERASGHKLVFRFGTTPELIKLLTTGGPFDLGVVPREVLKDAAARARFAAGPTTDIARVGLGVAVRSGAPKAGHQHVRSAEADVAQGAIRRDHTGKRGWRPGFAGVRKSRHQRGDESQDQGADCAGTDR